MFFNMKKKALSIFIVAAILLTSIPAFADTTVIATSTSPRTLCSGTATHSYFSTTGGTLSFTGNATKLTVRAYDEYDGQRNSNALTLKSSSPNGQRDYWDAYIDYTIIKGNLNYAGTGTLNSTWTY